MDRSAIFKRLFPCMIRRAGHVRAALAQKVCSVSCRRGVRAFTARQNRSKGSMVKTLLFVILILLLAVTGQPGDGRAYDEPAPQFFTALQDVPLMPGLHEVPEMTVVFDKPEGR